MVPTLQALALAAGKFEAAIERGWNHSSVAVTIPFIYNSTPEEESELRDIVVETMLQHDSLLDRPDIESAVCSISTLAYQLLKRKR